MSKSLVLSLIVLFSLRAFSSDLFSKGAETFTIQNQSGQTPTFRVLSDSLTKQALAVAVIGVLNAQDSVQPKIPVSPYLDLKFQTLTLTPEGRDGLALKLKLSGYDVDLSQTISKQELLSGKTVVVRYPETEKEVAMYTVDSGGSLKMRLEKAKDRLILEDVDAKMTFESPLGDEGSEAVHFSGTANRRP